MVMEVGVAFGALVILCLFEVAASLQCVDTQCFGSGVYCCGGYLDECCWAQTDPYVNWWVYFLWFWLMFMIVTCIVCICVRRRRLAQTRYMTIPASHPTYGAVAQPYYTPSYMSQPGGVYPTQGVPNVPPTAPAYQEKPPDYSAVVAGN